jgi:hypothetical protein
MEAVRQGFNGCWAVLFSRAGEFLGEKRHTADTLLRAKWLPSKVPRYSSADRPSAEGAGIKMLPLGAHLCLRVIRGRGLTEFR